MKTPAKRAKNFYEDDKLTISVGVDDKRKIKRFVVNGKNFEVKDDILTAWKKAEAYINKIRK